MSDLNRNNPNPVDAVGMKKQGRNPWQQPDPFASYDDPQAMPPADPGSQEDFSAWRRPPVQKGPSLFSEEPAPYGAEMLQGGVPLYAASQASAGEDDFARQGEDAPTRIGRPVLSPQMVSKRKTIDRSERPSFTPPFPIGERSPSQEAASPVTPPRAVSASTFSAPQPPAAGAEPEAAPAPSRSRRVSRTARYQEQGGAAPQPSPTPPASGATPSWAPGEAAAPSVFPRTREPLPALHPSPNAFDSFHEEEALPEAEDAPKSSRRPAVPGERYTGARTAIPLSGAPVLRSQVGALPEEQDSPGRLRNKARQARDQIAPEGAAPSPGAPAPYREPGPRPGPEARGPRPPMPPRPQGPQDGPARQSIPRPQGAPGQRPPMGPPPNGRPQRPLEEEDRSRRPARSNEGEGAALVRRQGAAPGVRPLPQFEEDSDRYAPPRQNENPRGRAPASVQRPRYDFEDDDEDDIPQRRRRGCLVPIVVLLLALGIALAGIWLPNWDAIGGPVGTALGGVKSTLKGFAENVISLVSPQGQRVTGFTVSPTEGSAPVALVFSVQTSTNVKDLRFVDEQGAVLLQKTMTDQDLLQRTVIQNNKNLIWSIPYTMEDAYSGLVTVQTLLSNGEWDEGMALASPLRIAGPVQPLPLVTSFSSDTTEGPVPATIRFKAQTGPDVVAVRVVDIYGTPVVSHSLGDGVTPSGSVSESAQSLTWDLSVDVDMAYEGDYTLQYQTVDDLNFNDSDYSVYVELSEPLSPEEAAGNSPEDGGDALGDAAGEDALANADGGDALGDASGEDAGPVVAANALLAGEDLGVDPPEEPIPQEPVETAPPAPSATPAPTPLPALTAQADESADPSAISLKKTIYNELKTTDSYSRAKALNILDPFNYAVWKQSGVLTFRNGPFRQNAAYGTVDVAQNTLTELWKVPVGSKKLNKSSVHGIAWPGQPIIVKWPTEVRNLMNLNEEKKATTALKEVILGGQDGIIYFLDLTDGKETRTPIDMGAPIGGGASLATNGTPILGIGQSHSNLASKQVPNGYHLFNLLSGKELLLLDGRDKSANTNYSGASGAALFDKQTQSLVVGGQNGVLYSVELNENFDHLAGSLKIDPAIQRYKTLAAKQDKKRSNIDGSVAMYGGYVFYGDESGVLQCMDINTLSSVWAVKTGDDINATPALDFEESAQTLALYTGNSIVYQGKSGVCTIRRYNALTGAEDWAYEVPDVAYSTEFKIGCMASPVVGENAIGDLVIFTVTNGKGGSQVIALKKADGAVAWTQKLESESESSPVAVYSDSGEAWLVQAERNGSVHLMNAKTGEILNTLKLSGEIEASPAVYRDILVIGTTGKDTGAIYGIRIQ